MSDKLQKVLARAGHGSRREMEAWIAAGRVSIDGEIAKLGDRIGADAKVRLDGRAVSLKSAEDIVFAFSAMGPSYLPASIQRSL